MLVFLDRKMPYRVTGFEKQERKPEQLAADILHIGTHKVLTLGLNRAVKNLAAYPVEIPTQRYSQT